MCGWGFVAHLAPTITLTSVSLNLTSLRAFVTILSHFMKMNTKPSIILDIREFIVGSLAHDQFYDEHSMIFLSNSYEP